MATSTLGNGTLVLAGTTSGTTTVTATAVAGTTTLTLPAATDTLVGKATTDTLTNKTLTGAAMNGTLGATTPSTVAATTISASSTATFAAGAAGTPSITTAGDTNTGIFFPAADTIAFSEGGAEIARFDSSGNFGLGVTPSNWGTFKAIEMNGGSLGSYTGNNLQITLTQNAYFNGSNYIYKNTQVASRYAQDTGAHIWYNAASGTAGNTITFTQAMTLDASGNLLVNSTTAFPDFSGTSKIQAVSATNAATFATTGGSSNSPYISWQQASTGFLAYFIYGTGGVGGNGTNCGSISYNGSLTLYTQTSDIRLKENITDAGSGLAKLANVKIRSYDWKKTGNHTDFGVVAQELQDVAPECVSIGQDNDNQTIKTPWSVDTSALVPAMIKAIQEQQALITTLTARITALESA
jgi:hypothetical protein